MVTTTMTYKFNIMDRVKRRVNVFDESSPFRYGTIILRESKDYRPHNNMPEMNWPELYTVLWDDGQIEGRFLPHGLRWEA